MGGPFAPLQDLESWSLWERPRILGLELELVSGHVKRETKAQRQQPEWGGGPPHSSQLLREEALRTRSSQQSPPQGGGSSARAPTLEAPPPHGLQDAPCPLQHLRLQVVFSTLRLHVLCISDSLDWMHGHAGT